MIIRKGEMRDIPEIMSIINSAKKFFRENGIDQWQNGVPNEETIVNDIKNGENYIVEDDGAVVATAMISLRGEPTYRRIYSGKWLCSGKYGVIHRVAVLPRQKRSGLASMLVEKAKKITLDAGYASLRIDTHENNLPMRKMIEKNGFVFCGTVFLADGSPRRAYEIILE
ncbi:MAG: GNAT family N-acetyltransferase [Clostridia bacterium]|nr:GNAT family N-acetyltransferase [Clostridia bacterium]